MQLYMLYVNMEVGWGEEMLVDLKFVRIFSGYQ